MSNIFDKFRGDEEAQPEEQLTDREGKTIQERTYSIRCPRETDDIEINYTIVDDASAETYVKQIKTSVLETGCCGRLCSYEPDSRYRPPHGRCQNPECKVLLCEEHTQRWECCICGRTLCVACRRQALGSDHLAFCSTHFEELCGETHRANVMRSLVHGAEEDDRGKKGWQKT